MGQDEIFTKAIEAAEHEAQEIREDIKRLTRELEDRNRRLTALSAFIENGRAVLGLAENAPARQQGQVIDLGDFAPENRSIWVEGAEILNKKQHPMHVRDIEAELVKAGRKFDSKNSTEIVRGALNRRSEHIESLGRGWYALRSWPSERKKRMPVTFTLDSNVATEVMRGS